jgi:hypothetical protein
LAILICFDEIDFCFSYTSSCPTAPGINPPKSQSGLR